MNTDEMSWLLQTIVEPETARRFVQDQYQRGRISYRVMANLVRESHWTNCHSVQALTVATPPLTDHATT
jgi:hypothetical protein